MAFKDQPIARKALILGIVPTVCAVLLVMLAVTYATYLQSSSSLVQDLSTESSIVADNVSAALAFNDKQAASDTVNAFRAKTNIEAVCVFDASGALFASMVRSVNTCPAQAGDSAPEKGVLWHQQPIMVGSRQVGIVRLVGNFSRLYEWMRRQGIVAAAMLIASFLLAFVLTHQIGRAITVPVLDLAATADRVSTTNDYSMRAAKTTDDELGRLAQSFNSMLDQIQRHHNEIASLLEREQETSRVKDQFLAAVSHELRTPLNAILGWVQILRTTNPTEMTLDRALESLERNARAQTRLIEDLIEISRVVTGKLFLRTEVVDVRSTVKAAVAVVHPAATAKGVHVTVTLPETPTLMMGDPDRLQQVAWNVISNAVKFTAAPGSVTVSLEVRGAELVLTVEDTGIGITAEFLPFVFDRFRQADGSLTRLHGGLGLGLAIVKDLTLLHGGSVTAISAGPGKGATFVVRLPRLVAAPGMPPPAERVIARMIPEADSLAGISVLAVDDDPDSLEILAEALIAAGADVQVAASGRAAIAACEVRSFDVLVCDLAMPQVDGFAVLAAMRRAGSAPALAIALTAHASQGDRDRSLAAGFAHHIGKPYDRHDLIDAIVAGPGKRSAPYLP